MKKFLKIFGVFIVLIIISLIAIPFFFQDAIAQAVKDAANENLNTRLEFSDLSLSLFSDFPDVSVTIDDFVLSGIEDFEGVDIANIGSIQATVNLGSLFGDTYSIKRVALISPKINARVLADGRANYDIVKESEDPSENSEAQSSSSPFALDFEEYEVIDGQVSYVDLSSPMTLKISGLNHVGSGDMTADQTRLFTKTTADAIDFVYDGVEYMRQVKANIDADLEMDLVAMRFVFAENVARLNELELHADGWVAMPDDNIEMDLTFGAPSSDFRQLISMIPAEFANDLADVNISGSMSLDGYAKGTYSDTMYPSFGITMKVADGRFNYPDLPKAAENIQIDAQITSEGGVDLDNTIVNVPRCYVEIADNPIDMKLVLSTPISDPDIDFQAQAKIIFEQFREVVPLEKGDELTGSINADIALKGKLSNIENENYEAFDASGQVIMQQVNYSSDSLPY
ncbi:MAG: AsmA family protein, partial [Flavobacteriales bacterium]|nr:AsmA family protein [Flavobacteriales bacterium]